MEEIQAALGRGGDGRGLSFLAIGGRIFLINVGANSSHAAKSPVFPDSTFEFVPIPEGDGVGASHLLSYGDLTSFNRPGDSLRPFIPQRLWSQPCHSDPEFETFTYGDNCDRSPRAAALKRVEPGDYLFFLARLVEYHNHAFSSQAGFYLIGFLEVEEVLPALRQAPAPGTLEQIRKNAHVRRALDDSNGWNGFWLFRGSAGSRRFRYAVPMTAELAQATLTDSRGGPWQWGKGRTPLQVIGSYTRSCRCILDETDPAQEGRLRVWWEAMAPAMRAQPVPLTPFVGAA